MTTPDSKEAPELKACPFCEAPGRFVWGLNDHGCVKCTRPGCDAKGGSFIDKRSALAAWDQRADLVNREPSEGDAITSDSSVYAGEFYGILNAQGQLWTPLAFPTRQAAIAHISSFWAGRTQREECLRTHKIVPVRVQLTAIQAPEEAS